MLNIVYLSFILILFSNIKDSFAKKHFYINSFFLVVSLGIILSGSFNKPDFIPYINFYENEIMFNSDLEKGYIFLVEIFKYFKFSYYEFFAAMYILWIINVNFIIKEYTKNKSLVYLLYFVYPFFLDAIQVRNFIFSILLIRGISYLINGKKGKFIVTILLGTLFHSIAYMYLPLLIIKGKFKNKLIKFISILSIFISLLIIINGNQIPFLNKILLIIKVDKIKGYLSTKTNYGYLIKYTEELFKLFIIYYSRKLYFKAIKSKKLEDIKKINFFNVIFWIHYLSIMAFPLYLLNSNFTRLTRNYLVFFYILIAMTYSSIKDRKSKIWYMILVIIFMLYQFYFHIWSLQNVMILDFFKYNIWLKNIT